MSRRWSAVLLLALALVGCPQREEKVEPARPQLENDRIVFPAESVQLKLLSFGTAKDAKPAILKLSGRLVWNEERTARVYPAFAGRVSRILAKPGDAVRAGHPLALVASPDFGLAQAEAHRAATDHALAVKNAARIRDLVENGVAPRKDLNAAEADLARAIAELERTRARLKLYGGADTIDQNFALRASVAGIVVERNVNPGQELRTELATSNAPALFVITDPTRLWLVIDVTERDLADVKPGRELKFHVGAYPEDTFVARIDVVSDFVDPQNRTIKARASVDNRERKLKGEMFATAVLEGEPHAGVEIPVRALFLDGDASYVFLEEGAGRFARVAVKPEGERNDKVRIGAGLKVGDKVVVDGSLLLQRLYTQLAKR